MALPIPSNAWQRITLPFSMTNDVTREVEFRVYYSGTGTLDFASLSTRCIYLTQSGIEEGLAPEE